MAGEALTGYVLSCMDNTKSLLCTEMRKKEKTHPPRASNIRGFLENLQFRVSTVLE